MMTDVRVTAPARKWLALSVLMLPVLLVSIDNTALNFAIPQIAQDLSPSAAQQLWIIDAYPLVLAGLLVAAGSLGDRIGRRKLLLIGATGFAIVSVVAAFSPTAEVLVAMRALLGLFGATLMPSTLSLLRSIFLDRAQRRLAIAIWATGFSVGSAIGPVVGGLLLTQFHWGSIFLIAVPILIPLLVLAPFLIDESRDPNPGPIDVIGVVASMAALGGLAAGIKRLATHGIDFFAAAVLLVAVVAGWVFVRRMLRSKNPMLDVRLMKIPEFSGALMINLLSVVALTGFLYWVTQHLQLVTGLSVFDAALVLVPGVLAIVLSGLLVVRVVKRFRPGPVVGIALSVSMLAYTLMLFAGKDIEVWAILSFFALLGIGIGAAETLSNDIVIASVRPEKAGAASALSETAYEFGAVLGTTLLGGLLTAVYRGSLVLPEDLDQAHADAAYETLGGAATVAEEIGGDAGAQLLLQAQHAFDEGATAMSGAGVVLMVGAVLIAFIALRRAKA
ncbi:MFS transporter [uncultured Agrococcus sp.]|uniref:MFS transporter n=1 Tax=uncultured Agrococcus sp. TaxID=382258 RepID=UPI0025DDFC23|nr:MFS transporter [uncultured Agrococcus sp.]